jgi:shikimate kinase
MIISQREFGQRMKEKRLRVALIGMSNIGKSYRARQLRDEKGFQLLSVDEEIERILGLEGIEAVSHWMGFPHERRYPQAEKSYLAAEAQVMGEIKVPSGKNFVLDTTGSLIYLDPNLLSSFKKKFLVIHLAVDEAIIPEMTDRFFTHPKPVIWGGMFQQRPKEALEVTFRRCYPEWLKFRLTHYRELADISISGAISRSKEVTSDQFTEAIRSALRAEPALIQVI